jgi:hypothetical protein
MEEKKRFRHKTWRRKTQDWKRTWRRIASAATNKKPALRMKAGFLFEI